MNYQQFRERLGKFTTPTDEQNEKLLQGKDSIHFVVILGLVDNGGYKITISEPVMDKFCDIISLLESRGAVRGKDFIVGGERQPLMLSLGIHTIHDFLSDEDFDSSINRFYSK